MIATAQAAGWSFNPAPLILLGPLTVAYVVRWRKVQAPIWRLVLFVLGMLAALAALLSPIDDLGHQLFTMHMVQHLLLLDIAPVLCLLGLTKAIFRPATKHLIRLERSVPWLLSPRLGLGLYIAGMWFWHLPPMYDAAVRHGGVHVLEHVTFTVIGGMYWWHLISPVRDPRHLSGMGAVLYMTVTKVAVGFLGIALTFMPRDIYSVYAKGENVWNLDPLTDQRMGGVLMATEQSIIMGIAIVWLVIQAIDRSEKEQLRREKYGDPSPVRPGEATAASGSSPPELY